MSERGWVADARDDPATKNYCRKERGTTSNETMEHLYLNSDEAILLTTQDLLINGIRHEAVLSLGISSDEVVVALIGALILVFGSVMADATRIAEENREII